MRLSQQNHFTLKAFAIGILFLLQGFLCDAQQKKLVADELQNTKLSPKTLQNLQWIANTDNYSFQANNALLVCKGGLDKRDTMVRLADINSKLSGFKVEAQKKFPSVKWTNDHIFTFIIKNHLLAYDIASKQMSELNSWNEKGENADVDYNMYTVAYTVENNLFLSVNGQEIPLSNETDKGISNGSPNVHRHEWGITKGTFWSPKGNFLAFYRMDETMVADFPLLDITTEIATTKNTKYPMAGKPSHQVLLGICNISKGKILYVKTGEPKDQFLTNVTWSPDEKYIYIALLNRAQNHMKLNQYDAITGDFVKTLFEEKNERYVEPQHPIVFLKKAADQFLWQSQRDGYNHIYLYNIDGKLIRQLTKGSWVVNDVYGTDADEKFVYFSGRAEGPLEKHIYSAELSTANITKITSEKGLHTAIINAAGDHIIDNFNSPVVPASYSVLSAKGKGIYSIQISDNPLKEYSLGECSIVEVIAKDGTSLYGRLIKPVDFNPEKKYPVIIYVYGGPHSQLVNYSWLSGANLYLNYLATKGYAVFTLDNRGTANRGFEFESCIHRNLGKIEVSDQMDGVKYLKSLAFIDSTRIGIDGWSYGGFMTLSMLTGYPETFKAACAGGPVIDWKYYEVMYGERYMDTPEENPEGYKNANLIDKADKLKAKLLILQGTLDETVVWQNSLNFIKKCVDTGTPVEYFVFPGHEHNVRGKDRIYMFKKIAGFFDENL